MADRKQQGQKPGQAGRNPDRQQQQQGGENRQPGEQPRPGQPDRGQPQQR